MYRRFTPLNIWIPILLNVFELWNLASLLCLDGLRRANVAWGVFVRRPFLKCIFLETLIKTDRSNMGSHGSENSKCYSFRIFDVSGMELLYILPMHHQSCCLLAFFFLNVWTLIFLTCNRMGVNFQTATSAVIWFFSSRTFPRGPCHCPVKRFL